MLYFVHRLNTDMFLDLSIKNTVIIKLLAYVIAAFFVGTKNFKQNIICQSNRLTPCVNAKRQPFLIVNLFILPFFHIYNKNHNQGAKVSAHAA